MRSHLSANLWLLALTLLLGAVLYPLALLAVGQTFFRHQAEGSMINSAGQPVTTASEAVGSRLIAQPFTADQYFQPRPSAVSFNATASGASNWGANNYLLRDRVARQLGPIVKYQSGAKQGQLAAPDIEAWFQKDRFRGQPGIVGQWANAHAGVAQNWVKADPLNSEYVAAWQKSHPDDVKQWIKENPDNTDPKPLDLAVAFFNSYSRTGPGTFPGVVEHKSADGKTTKSIEPVKDGTDIQGMFFDMWRQDHADVALQDVPADMVMSCGSGLDPHITLANARYQLDRVAGTWATKLHRDPAAVRLEIEKLLRDKTAAPLRGLVGVDLVNVLEVNLAMKNQFAPAGEAKGS
ncbi:MAG: potassium-transporting ATPase subunit C [Planctomycetia bacterium]|nr:potassium-transporting ATPase subunit C [Planctomycetia bacterium]